MTKVKHPERFSYDQIKAMITNIPNQDDKYIACLAYATGARVSELIKLTHNSIYFDKINGVDYMGIICPVLKKRKVMVKGVLTSNVPDRKAWVRIDEEWLTRPILDRYHSFSSSKLIPYHRATVYKKLVACTGFNPHFFRKLRATHLRRNFNFDSYQLKKFFGWSSISPSEYYVGLDDRDIMY